MISLIALFYYCCKRICRTLCYRSFPQLFQLDQCFMQCDNGLWGELGKSFGNHILKLSSKPCPWKQIKMCNYYLHEASLSEGCVDHRSVYIFKFACKYDGSYTCKCLRIISMSRLVEWLGWKGVHCLVYCIILLPRFLLKSTECHADASHSLIGAPGSKARLELFVFVHMKQILLRTK